MKRYILLLLLPLIAGCVAGAGFDRSSDCQKARMWGKRTVVPEVTVITESVAQHTYAYKPSSPFEEFQHHGMPIMDSETSVPGTDYRVVYRKRHLTIYRGQNPVVSEQLPVVFNMHPLCTAVLPGLTSTEDVLVCSIRSRASTRCHLLLVYDGNGKELFVQIFDSANVADILMRNGNELIVGGPISHTILTFHKKKEAQPKPEGDGKPAP